MGRRGYDTTGLGGLVRPNPRPAGGSKAGGGCQKGGKSAMTGQECTQQSHAAAAGSASASATDRAVDGTGRMDSFQVRRAPEMWRLGTATSEATFCRP
ncbi:hypothetical protein LZ31DRAFT_591411 [Colletotrichum somersetense]|nr:hypothetical protein LZ31DRAFT_591411 [Colletotrichum somersetense]